MIAGVAWVGVDAIRPTNLASRLGGASKGGFALVSGLFGIPADTAIALSMVKRARELAVGVPGLLAWQWSELRRPGTPA